MPTPQEQIQALLAQLLGSPTGQNPVFGNFLRNQASIGTSALDQGATTNANISALMQRLLGDLTSRGQELGVGDEQVGGVQGIGALQQQLGDRLQQLSADQTSSHLRNAEYMAAIQQLAAAQAAAPSGGSGGGGGGGGGGRRSGGGGGGGGSSSGDRVPLYDDRDVRGYNRDQTELAFFQELVNTLTDEERETETQQDWQRGARAALDMYEANNVRPENIGQSRTRNAIMGLLTGSGQAGDLAGAAGQAWAQVNNMGVDEDGRIVLTDDINDDYLSTAGGRGLERQVLLDLLGFIAANPTMGSSSESTTSQTRDRTSDRWSNKQTSSLTEGGTSARGIGVQPELALNGMFPGYEGFNGSVPQSLMPQGSALPGAGMVPGAPQGPDYGGIGWIMGEDMPAADMPARPRGFQLRKGGSPRGNNLGVSPEFEGDRRTPRFVRRTPPSGAQMADANRARNLQDRTKADASRRAAAAGEANRFANARSNAQPRTPARAWPGTNPFRRNATPAPRRRGTKGNSRVF